MCICRIAFVCSFIYNLLVVENVTVYMEDVMVMNRIIARKLGSLLMAATMAAGMTAVPGHTAYASTTFYDVDAGAYYADAVDWAVENGITKGTAAGYFSPGADCTRAQMVTFLYKAFGESGSVSKGELFFDVSKDSYYCEAVNWAVENGITTGVSNTRFDPDGKCTRAQAVTFISRLIHIDDIDLTSAENFSDVRQGDYYCDAVRWAVKEGIARGTGNGAFSPAGTCNRAQIVTFLYRFRQMQDKATELIKANDIDTLISKYGSVMEEALFYSANGGNASLFDAYFTPERCVWNVNGREVLIKDSDGTYYGGEMGTDGTTIPFKIIFGSEATKELYDGSMSMETGLARLQDSEVLVKDIYTDGGDTVLVIENPDITEDYLTYVDSGYRGQTGLVATFRFSGRDGGRLKGMTADYLLANGSTLKAMKTSVFYGNEQDSEGILIGERIFKDAGTLRSALKGSNTRALRWTIDPGTASERVITDTVAKGVGFCCLLSGSTGIYLDPGLTNRMEKGDVDYNSDLIAYSGTR